MIVHVSNSMASFYGYICVPNMVVRVVAADMPLSLFISLYNSWGIALKELGGLKVPLFEGILQGLYNASSSALLPWKHHHPMD